MGQISLGGSFVIRVLQLTLQWINLPLGGQWRGFSPSSLVSSSITRLGVILCLHLSSLLFQLSFYCCYLMKMAQSSLLFVCSHSLFFHTQLSQSKINRAVIFYLGSKQALVFLYKFELSYVLVSCIIQFFKNFMLSQF